MKSVASIKSVFCSLLAVAVLLAAGCNTTPTGNGGGDGGSNGGGDGGGNGGGDGGNGDGGNGGGGDGGNGDGGNGGGDNGGGDNGGDNGGSDNDDPIVALILTGQNTNHSSFDDVVGVDGENILSSTALEYGNASGVLRGQDAVVSSNGVLFICSESNDTIAIYESFLTASGTRQPDRTVSGEATLIDAPISVAIDQENDVLYVIGKFDEFVYVFEDVSLETFDGEVEPSRMFTRNSGTFSPDQVFFADGSVYVADDEFIYIFEDDGTLEGDVQPDRQFSSGLFGSNTRYNISVDSRDRLILTDRDDEVFIYNNASTIDGSPAPDLTITIEDTGSLHAASIDSFDTLYAMDLTGDAIYVFDDVEGMIELGDGTYDPDRIIKGPDFNSADRMFLHERLP
ncbi:MAG: hypothetical protein DHS20C16_31720 [Phycisphaerae bacterium]|nr:MAG: hypothetical protein DHS20C16_31720 [Phycisphaerae bacterium]